MQVNRRIAAHPVDVVAIVASVRAETSSPFRRSVEMSPFWQNAQRMLHEVKKIVPEPCVPRYTSSSPPWWKCVATRVPAPAVHAAVPAAEVAVREHAPGELRDEIEQARPRPLLGQTRDARADAFLQREEALRSCFERAPQVFFGCVERDAGGKARADAELGGQAVGADLAIPPHAAAEISLAPEGKRVERAHGAKYRPGAVRRRR